MIEWTCISNIHTSLFFPRLQHYREYHVDDRILTQRRTEVTELLNLTVPSSAMERTRLMKQNII